MALAALIAVAVIGFVESPKQPANEQAQPEPESAKCEDRGYWGKTLCDPVAGFTGALALFSALLTVVSFVQIRFLIRADVTARRGLIAARRAGNRQSRQMYQSLAIAAKQAQAALQQAEAAERQADAVIGVEIARFWMVQIDLINFPSTKVVSYEERLKQPWLRVVFKNIGKTPGGVYAMEWDTFIGRVLPEDDVEEPTYTGFELKSPVYQVESGAMYDWSRPIKSPTPDEYERLKIGGALYWFFGQVWYRDFTGKPHGLKFCANVGMGGLLRPTMTLMVGGPRAYVE